MRCKLNLNLNLVQPCPKSENWGGDEQACIYATYFSIPGNKSQVCEVGLGGTQQTHVGAPARYVQSNVTKLMDSWLILQAWPWVESEALIW